MQIDLINSNLFALFNVYFIICKRDGCFHLEKIISRTKNFLNIIFRIRLRDIKNNQYGGNSSEKYSCFRKCFKNI